MSLANENLTDTSLCRTQSSPEELLRVLVNILLLMTEIRALPTRLFIVSC